MIAKKLPTYTLITSNLVQVYTTTYYELPYNGAIIKCFINPEMQLIDGTPFPQGHLILIKKQNAQDHVMSIDSSGDLILTAPSQEVTKYSIDNDGNLIYTTTL